MKALTLTQPWASAIALGHKRFETRSFRTNHRGRIAIHAAKGFPKAAQHFASTERALGRCPERIPLAAIVAVATIIDCQHTEVVVNRIGGLERHLGDYTCGRYAWEFADILALREPIPCLGMLGLWTVPAEIEAAISAQLAVRA